MRRIGATFWGLFCGLNKMVFAKGFVWRAHRLSAPWKLSFDAVWLCKLVCSGVPERQTGLFCRPQSYSWLGPSFFWGRQHGNSLRGSGRILALLVNDCVIYVCHFTVPHSVSSAESWSHDGSLKFETLDSGSKCLLPHPGSSALSLCDLWDFPRPFITVSQLGIEFTW